MFNSQWLLSSSSVITCTKPLSESATCVQNVLPIYTFVSFQEVYTSIEI